DLLALGQTLQEGTCGLGGWDLAWHELLDHVDAGVACAVRQGAAQCGGLHLLRGALGVVARLRAVHRATTGEVWGADGALACAPGALLAEWLSAAAAVLAATLGCVRALALRCELSCNDLVHQRDGRLNIEDGCWELYAAVGLTISGMYIKLQIAHALDRKSTRLNSSHVSISYAVFCLKKKK